MFVINDLKLSSMKVKSDKKIEIGIIVKLHFVSLNFSDLRVNLNLIEKYKISVRKNFKNELIQPLMFLEVMRKIAADIHESPTKFREIPALVRIFQTFDNITIKGKKSRMSNCI